MREEGSDRPIGDAIVWWGGSQEYMRTTFTGHYRLTRVHAEPRDPPPTLATATIQITARRFGYYHETRELVVLDGDTAHLDFYLRPDHRREIDIEPEPRSVFVPDTILLERTRCYGTCPAYRVTLTSDGRIAFQSRNPGDSTAASDRVSTQVFTALLNHAKDAGFFDMPRQLMGDARFCPIVATDHATATIIIRAEGGRHVVEDYLGCGLTSDPTVNRSLSRLRQFEAVIDSALGSSRWVRPSRSPPGREPRK